MKTNVAFLLMVSSVASVAGCCCGSPCRTCSPYGALGVSNGFAYGTAYGNGPVAYGTPVPVAQAFPGQPGLMSTPGQPALVPVPQAFLPVDPRIRQMTYAEVTGPARPRQRIRHLNCAMHPGSRYEKSRRFNAGLPGGPPQLAQLENGLFPTPSQDLRYRGGRVIQNLKFVNIYLGGKAAWDPQDQKSIDAALDAAMSDQYLNNVVVQYFNNNPISSELVKSFFLEGEPPQVVSQGDIESMLSGLANQGSLSQYDLTSTVFNFLLPSGTILNDNAALSNGTSQVAQTTAADADKNADTAIPTPDEGDSRTGLGGYHGSIHVGQDTILYAVGAYSEKREDGTSNGIPAFDENWKNVVATFYHEMNEVRTDPDVSDAIRNPDDPNATRYLGWTSDKGEECGDFPIDEDAARGKVFVEVPLADGSGTVPVQLVYSNAVHGPEGPIRIPHDLPANSGQ